MRGDTKSFAEAVEICERVQRRKWLVQTNSMEEMREMAKQPGKEFYNQVRIAFAEGRGVVGDELNREFPDVRPVTCEEFIEKWWGGVELGEASWGEDKSFM